MEGLEHTTILLPEEFGAAVRAARRQRGMSQVQLAEACGCSQRFVSQLERGKPTAELGKALQAASCVGLRLRLDSRLTVDETREMVDQAVERIVKSTKAKRRPRPKLSDYLKDEG